MIVIVVALPLLNYIILSTLGRKLGSKGSIIVSILNISLALVSIIVVIATNIETNSVVTCISIGLLICNWSIIVDPLVSGMLVPVLGISFVVHIFSLNYIIEDPSKVRFFSLLGLFTGSILLLVVSENIVQLFVGWEAIGVASFLLIGFWTSRLSASNASIQAFLTNRTGDWVLAILVYILWHNFGSLNITTINFVSTSLDLTWLIAILIVGSAIAKSAQLGLHTWLPTSIEGPTPVSALIHAATLVTAGVFLCLRLSPLLNTLPNGLLIIGILGGSTAVIAGLTGLVQNDIKRIIAYSTIAQVGYIFIALGLGEFNTALQHLINHAFFKALLFLSAGSLIHGFKDLQDIRKYGNLLHYIPLSYVCILIGSLSLIAIPFLTGFYSKDLILELALAQYNLGSFVIYGIGVVAAFLTAFYSFRLLNMVFNTTSNGNIEHYSKVHESSLFLLVPMLILLLISIMLGFFLKEIFCGSSLFSNVLPVHNLIIGSEFNLTVIDKTIPLIASLLGALASLSQVITSVHTSVYNVLINKFLIDVIYNKVLVNKGLTIGLLTNKVLDRGWLEPFLAAKWLTILGKKSKASKICFYSMHAI